MVRFNFAARSCLFAPSSANFRSVGENARAKKNREANSSATVLKIQGVLHVHGPRMTSRIPDPIITWPACFASRTTDLSKAKWASNAISTALGSFFTIGSKIKKGPMEAITLMT